MKAVRNSWYCAGFSHEVTRSPIVRTFLDEPILMMRAVDGRPVAMSDKCAHRFAPLHRGKVDGDHIRCIYHGLKYDMSGLCVDNPHGNHLIPPGARVRSYATAELFNVVWIWMGDPTAADENKIPRHWQLSDNPQESQIYGHLMVDCHYQHVVDNLMDVSHIEFLHPWLGAPGQTAQLDIKVTPNGPVGLRYLSEAGDTAIGGVYRLVWGEGAPEKGHLSQSMYWDAPSNLCLDAQVSADGDWESPHPRLRVAHMLTPESDGRTHYFWTSTRNWQVFSTALNEQLAAGLTDVFVNEDAMILERAQSYMGTHDLMAAKPVLLSIDAAAQRTRRIVEGLIRAEDAIKSLPAA